MRILKLVFTIALVCLVAAACSGDTEDRTLPVPASDVDSGSVGTTEIPVPGSTNLHDLAEAMLTVMFDDDERPIVTAVDQIECMVLGLAEIFPDDRLVHLGLNGPSVTAIYENRGSFGFGEAYEITDGEASGLVDVALECVDWRAVLADEIAREGLPLEQAMCIATEISDEALWLAVLDALITEPDGDFDVGEVEAQEAIQACVNVREMLFEIYVQEGLSEQSARCVADGLPQEMVDMMLGGEEPEDEEAPLEMMDELMALQNRCLTPDEIEAMGGSGFQPGGPIPEGSIGTGGCPPADGSGPTVLHFDSPQPMCLDATKQYTAVFDTSAGEMRIALDMVNTPITANNFAVLAQYHYYDDTLLFRTDPGIGIIQGGAPHTNSPTDPGPGYTIPDEGWGFTYEPGQIVMARTAAPNSAGAQFFFAVNEQTALLNSQGTYVVFGQMDEESLAVAEAILASHVDQPDNPLGGGPEPSVFVNSVIIEETG